MSSLAGVDREYLFPYLVLDACCSPSWIRIATCGINVVWLLFELGWFGVCLVGLAWFSLCLGLCLVDWPLLIGSPFQFVDSVWWIGLG